METLVEAGGGGGAVTLGRLGEGLEPPRVAKMATATPARTRIGSATRTGSGALILREGRGLITWVTADADGAAPTMVGASPPRSRSRSAPPSGGREAGFFASALSARAASTGGAPGRTADKGGGVPCT